MRQEIRKEIETITPLDDVERQTKSDVLGWIDSGAEICRTEKPATPPKHLVSYFAVIDGEYILLVDHINAELWLPTGGHVEPGEHPRTAALREAKEELSIDGEFLHSDPVFLTVAETVGRTAGHTDVSLWYTLRGNRNDDIAYDTTEFRAASWFHRKDVPLGRSDIHMERFLRKLYGE
ncbi:MAG: NUDIX domain-containing protein [Woeseiaceae bacterium]